MATVKLRLANGETAVIEEAERIDTLLNLNKVAIDGIEYDEVDQVTVY